ncbi:MAG TPA: hypothetical protein VHC22_00280 [Pirellulales bacterium]|nr:hypothetical protein [Pirellulales bacterium]
MPFIFQCPYADCRKFMLLEDSTRGSAVDCIVCRRPMQVDASSAGSATPATTKSPSWSLTVPATSDSSHRIHPCPHCHATLRLSAGKTGDIKCPKCKHVFTI